VSDDVTPEETGTTPAGQSIQRRGQGRRGAEFQWHGPASASPRQVNQGQTFP